MKIKPTQVFIDARTRFDPSSKYIVPDDAGGYYVRCGWAARLPGDDEGPFLTVTDPALGTGIAAPPKEEVVLSVDDVVHVSTVPEV
ncbi:MAG: hypothetical protein KIT73_04225 [Burkholderiales bacterium]|nr:hypothetical protein [Burkholderiales bacterium]